MKWLPGPIPAEYSMVEHGSHLAETISIRCLNLRQARRREDVILLLSSPENRCRCQGIASIYRRLCQTRNLGPSPPARKISEELRDGDGEVISVGNGRSNEDGKVFPLALKGGDHILFAKYAGTEIKIDGEEFLIMKEEEVLGVVSGAAKKETVGARW